MAWQDYLTLPPEWNPVMPELIVLLFALIIPVAALYDRATSVDARRRGTRSLALIGLAGAFVLTLGGLLDWQVQAGGFTFTFGSMGTLKGVYEVSAFSQVLKVLFLGTAFLAILGAGRTLKGKAEEDHGEFHSLILFATFGMMAVASARDLVLLLIAIETASMCSYLLAAFRRDKVGAEAGLKYFAVGALSSGMNVFAVSLLYGMAGTTNLYDLGSAIGLGGDFDAMSTIAIVLLLAGLGFKISSVPFHAWAPDVYSGASPAVAGLLAGASKAMGFAAVFTVFLVGLADIKPNWELAVAVIAVVSMFVGNLVALQQTSIRRMLAFSSIAQAGYLLIAVAVGSQLAVGGGILHLLVNAAMKLGAFLAVGALLLAGVQDHIDGWKGLGRRAPILAFAMVLFLLSMAGLPPLGGFASKFVLFGSAVQTGLGTGAGWLVLLALAAVVNSGISLFYYLRVIRAMYVDGEEPPVHGAPGGPSHAPMAAPERVPVSLGATVAVVVCAVLVVVIGVWPKPFLDVSIDAAASLLAR